MRSNKSGQEDWARRVSVGKCVRGEELAFKVIKHSDLMAQMELGYA
jgi:hypothetical protein